MTPPNENKTKQISKTKTKKNFLSVFGICFVRKFFYFFLILFSQQLLYTKKNPQAATQLQQKKTQKKTKQKKPTKPTLIYSKGGGLCFPPLSPNIVFCFYTLALVLSLMIDLDNSPSSVACNLI